MENYDNLRHLRMGKGGVGENVFDAAKIPAPNLIAFMFLGYPV